MEVIAKTEKGFLIQATRKETEEILKSVTGKLPEKIEIGQKVPAIDYATTITKVKALQKNYAFEQMISKIKTFNNEVSKLESVIEKASSIEI